MNTPEQRLRLRPREDRRLRAGHLWVYSNEVDVAATPLSAMKSGDLARLEDARGAPLGRVTVNPHALLCARVLTSRADAAIDREWFVQRLHAALLSRQSLYAQPFYRLVHGEADGLPGLVVDRYGEVLVVQLATAGMERLRTYLLDALHEVLQPRGVLLRNDVPMRQAEGLPLYIEAVGAVPDHVELDEGGVRFRVPLRSGQKTGWFFDQRDNRDRLRRYAHGARTLDVCAYVGAWGLRAAGFGAATVSCVDSAVPALELTRANATLNGTTVETFHGQALDTLEKLSAQGRRFDLVVLDPPALIKRRKDHAAGLAHYRRLNRAALAVLEPGGVLVSCSCSFHLETTELQRALLQASRSAGLRLAILEQGGQGPDHPVHPAIPETRYLKAIFCRVMAD